MEQGKMGCHWMVVTNQVEEDLQALFEEAGL